MTRRIPVYGALAALLLAPAAIGISAQTAGHQPVSLQQYEQWKTELSTGAGGARQTRSAR